MKKLVIYIHGKGGNIKEIDHYKQMFKDYDMIWFDYHSDNLWAAKKELTCFFDLCSKKYEYIILIANSIGAYYSLYSLNNKKIDKAFFISPIVNMEKLIYDMMNQANITEEELKEKQEIKTDFGETLSWIYLCYAKEQKIEWNINTFILYGEKDALTTYETISEFAKNIGASLTVMPNGMHWFHTDEQMKFLDDWIKSNL